MLSLPAASCQRNIRAQGTALYANSHADIAIQAISGQGTGIDVFTGQGTSIHVISDQTTRARCGALTPRASPGGRDLPTGRVALQHGADRRTARRESLAGSLWSGDHPRGAS